MYECTMMESYSTKKEELYKKNVFFDLFLFLFLCDSISFLVPIAVSVPDFALGSTFLLSCFLFFVFFLTLFLFLFLRLFLLLCSVSEKHINIFKSVYRKNIFFSANFLRSMDAVCRT